MYSKRYLIGLLCLIVFGFGARAQTVVFQNLDENSFKQVVGDLSTNFMHTSVSGASTLGHIFGFEVGVVGGSTSTPHVNSLAQQADPSANASKIYDAAILGVLTVPLGFSAELGILPRVGPDNFKFSNYGLAVKWTATEVFGDLPLSLAAKLSVTKTAVDFSQSYNGTPINYNYKGSVTNLMFIASKNLAILEPYFGIGYVSAKGDLNETGSTTVFIPSFSTSNSASASRTGTAWMIGTEVKLLVVKLGVEYTNMLDTSRVMGKLSVFF